MSLGKLSIIATPIGNLGDITDRARETMEQVDLLLCEDTRVTRKLLSAFDISTKTQSYHQHSDDGLKNKILERLRSGEHLGLVSDAGTPGISDPGNELISFLLGREPELQVEPIPGAAACIAALSISGFPTDAFLFLGFPPHKRKRKQFFEKLAAAEHTVVLYESNHRIKKALADLEAALDANREVCVCRELTKKFETIYRGSVGGLSAMDINEKGEFVLVIKKPPKGSK